jgi:Rps23 Pro-64 3,4-dihydroxylase Tpa1-like proline 4-hydroxylase
VFVPFENFLTATELDQLMQFTLAQKQRFEPSSIVDRATQMPVINQRVRSSKTLDDVGPFQRLFVERLKERLAPILEKLKYPGFKLGEIELQITASNDGDFYRLHPDSDGTSTRELSFVYFFFREPQPFSGGEFRIFETQLVGNRQVPVDRHHTLVPRRNGLIVFPSRHEHELLPVRVASKEFADSRFTVNGWIHRA